MKRAWLFGVITVAATSMTRRWLATVGALGLAGGVLAVQACSSNSSNSGAESGDSGSDSGYDATSSGASSGSSSGSSSGASSGSSSGASSGSSSGASSGSSSGTADGGDGGGDSGGEAGKDAEADAQADAATPDATCTPFDAGAIDPNAADAGMQLVLQYRCYGCHQSNALDAGGLILSGHNTSLSDASLTFPPNLTPDPATGLGCWTNQQISTALLDGVDNENASLCVMPRFRSKFAEAGVDVDASAGDIIAFLRTLTAVSNQVPNTVCPSPPGDAGADAGDAADQ